jgi:hypothetical protein
LTCGVDWRGSRTRNTLWFNEEGTMDPVLKELIAELQKILAVVQPRIYALPDKAPGQGLCVALVIQIEEAIEAAETHAAAQTRITS